jgi:Zn finger protein HypA/HybF involved in hydrogenase expression
MFNIVGLENRIDNDNNNRRDRDNKKELSRQTHFLLCESCLWCASYISSKNISIVKCPNCYSNKIEWMPISKVDIDKLTRSSKQGDSVAAIQHNSIR